MIDIEPVIIPREGIFLLKAREVKKGKGQIVDWASHCPAASHPRFTQLPHSLEGAVTVLSLQRRELSFKQLIRMDTLYDRIWDLGFLTSTLFCPPHHSDTFT